MTATATEADALPSRPAEPWAPTAYTAPLAEPMVTDGDRLLDVVDQCWTTEAGDPLILDTWQRWLIRAILERYPDDWPEVRLRGRLRYRQVVVSMGRQNGKSLLAAILGFYGLAMHTRGPLVVGLAYNRDQANIVYNRVKHTIKSNRWLTARFKPTGTRGISARSGTGSYVVKPSKGEAIQGIPVTLGLFDELHISKPEMWAAGVNGQRANPAALLVGITTAGDQDSELLKSLYAQGMAAIDAAEPGRFGFYLWEAPEGAGIDTPGAIEAANPAVACGRIDADTVREDVRPLPVEDQTRYTLNRWVASGQSWMPASTWTECPTGRPAHDRAVILIDRTPSWEHAAITANRADDGDLATELVASLNRPTLDRLERVCEAIAAGESVTFAMDRVTLGALADRLERAGHTVRRLSHADVMQAGPAAYAAIVSGRVAHPADPLVVAQIPRARRKNVGDGWRLSRVDSADIDAAMATVLGLYAAETDPDPGPQLF